MLDAFHFLRPEWFLALLPAALLLFLLVRRSNQKSGWENVCDASLLKYQLAQQKNSTSPRSRLVHWIVPFILLFTALLLTIIALAGPAWEKKEQPIFQQDNALVIILDLSLSMNAKDIKPSRIERAKLKIIDILKQKKEGQTALIAFAGDAHIVSPLTIDNKTIISLLPALETSIMPLPGSYIDDALLTAERLLKNAGFVQGDILLMSDGIDLTPSKVLKKQIKNLHQQGYSLSIIGVGSQAGSPIPIPGQGGFIKDTSGQVILSKLTPDSLKELTRMGGGSYHKLSLDDKDFTSLVNRKFVNNKAITEQDNQIEQWVDAGRYVTLLILPFALLAFRKGLLSVSVVLLLAPSFFSQPVLANERWNNLWLTPDQQGQKAFKNQNYQQASDKFVNKNWKAGAYYRSGEFGKAAEQYGQSDDTLSLYNKGNALANQQKYEDAIQAYEQALKKDPKLSDAMQNRDYLKELLAQQKKQQSEQQQSTNSEDQSDEQSKNQDQQSDSNNSQSQQSENNSEQNKADQNGSDPSNDENTDAGNKKEEQAQEDSSQQDEEQTPKQAQQQNAQEEPATGEEPSTAKEPSTDKDSLADKESSPNKESVPNEAKSQLEESEQEKNQNEQRDDVLSQLSQEEQQSLKQWLQRIPDNPGNLLRIKFRNNSLLKQRQQDAPAQYEGNPW